MKIWVLSDLHIELTKGWDLPGPAERPDFDVLVMAGDLIPGMERGADWLRERVTDRPVIYIPGNHEAYGQDDIDRTVERAKEAAAGSNVLVLQNEATVVAGVQFICATMWTDFALFGAQQEAMDVAQYRMNDFKRIRTAYGSRRLLAFDTLRRHRASRKFIERELALPFAGLRVVVSHHGPHRDARRPGAEWDFISAAYTSDLEELIMVGRPDAWIYGHVHISDDRIIGETRVISNSKGYGPHPQMGLRTWDNPNFDPHFVIEV